MNTEHHQNCMVMVSLCILNIEKKSCSNDEDTSTVFRNPSGSLSEPRKPSSEMPRFVKTLHSDYLQNILNFYHCIMKSNHGTIPSFIFF